MGEPVIAKPMKNYGTPQTGPRRTPKVVKAGTKPAERSVITSVVKKKPATPEFEIEVTSEYDVFERMPGNRPVDEHWVAYLMRKMAKKDLKVAIQINQNFEVVDGQHRLEARRRLGLPVYYYVINDLDLEDVQEMNASVKKWTLSDHVDSFIELGKKDYEIYKWFKQQYTLPHQTAVQLLMGVADSKNTRNIFISGSFKVADLEKAKATATMLSRLQDYFSHWNNRNFLSAMLFALNKKGFDFERFMKKLELNPTSLKPQASIEMYILHIEDIFNYRTANKISLRYGEDIST
jgi:hypothetical protein